MPTTKKSWDPKIGSRFTNIICHGEQRISNKTPSRRDKHRAEVKEKRNSGVFNCFKCGFIANYPLTSHKCS